MAKEPNLRRRPRGPDASQDDGQHLRAVAFAKPARSFREQDRDRGPSRQLRGSMDIRPDVAIRQIVGFSGIVAPVDVVTENARRTRPTGRKKTGKNHFGRYTVGVRNDEVATHPLCHNLTSSWGGAGGNRTPVHQAMSARATTIPEVWPNGSHLPGQLTLRSPPRLSSKPADFPAVSGLPHRHRLLLVPGCS
jgi:hypothetical protein